MKKSLSRIALESEREGAYEEVIAPAGEEAVTPEILEERRRTAELAEAQDDVTATIEDSEELDQEVDQRQQEAFAFECLHAYGDFLRHQIATGTVTMESIAWVQAGVQQVYASQGVRMRTIATESNMTAPAYAKYVLESLALESEFSESGMLKKIGTVLGALVGKLSSWHKINENTAERLRGEYERDKAAFGSNVKVNLGIWWRWFASDEGKTRNIVQEIGKNTALSKHILLEWAPKAAAEIDKFTHIVQSGSLQDEQSAIALAKAIEGLTNPVAFFNQQFITHGKKPYFGVMGIDQEEGAKRKVLSIGEQSFPKLAELSSTMALREKGSIGHKLKSAADAMTGSYGSLAAHAFNGKEQIPASDFVKFLEGAELYVTVIGDSLRTMEKVEHSLQQAYQALVQLQGKTAPEFKQIFNQIAQTGEVLGYATYSLIKDEQGHAATGVHYMFAAVGEVIRLANAQGKKEAKQGGKFDNSHEMDDAGNITKTDTGEKVAEAGNPDA